MKTKFASVRTELPGPRSLAIAERKKNAVTTAAFHSFPIAIASAKNALLTDVDRNVFIDFASGIGCLNVGHANPQVMRAAKKQLEKFNHLCVHVALYEGFIELAEKINRLTPGHFAKKTYLVNSGAEAIENAVKIARYATGRSAIVALEHAFHGRTLLGMSLTGKVLPYKKGFGPFAPEIYHLPFPLCSRCEKNRNNGQPCCMASPEAFHALFLTRVPPEQVAAIVFEPVLGEGGFLPLNRTYLNALADFAREHGILLIADEIQTGWARTGKLFAMEHFDLAADITVTAKSLGGGFPISSVTGRAELFDSVHAGGIGSTFAGNPVSCAAALAAIDFIIANDLPARACTLGERVRGRLAPLAVSVASVGDVRGIGAMNAIEFVRDKQSRTPAPDLMAAVQKQAFQNGLITLKAGSYGNVLRTLMPLTIEYEILDEGLDILANAIENVARSAL